MMQIFELKLRVKCLMVVVILDFGSGLINSVGIKKMQL